MKYKMMNVIGSYEDLKDSITKGAKFHVFSYRIGLGFVSLYRLSPAILIKDETTLKRYIVKYNRLNLLCGPWTFFRGPWYTYQSYLMNKEGGIDVTKDVLVNLSQENFNNTEVFIETIHSIFGGLSRDERKGLNKAIKRTDLNLMPLKRVYAARFVNVEDGYEPPIVIGIELINDKPINDEHIRKNLKKYFFRSVPFDIINIKTDDIAESLVDQGELLYGKSN